MGVSRRSLGALAAAAAASVAVVNLSGGSSRESLVPLDQTDWSRGDHPLGRGAVAPANVENRSGQLALRLDPEPLRGGEVVSRQRYGDGTFGARLRLPRAPGSLTGLFLYEPPDLQSEIDIELVNDRQGRVLFTIYHRGRERHFERRLGFDPTAAFHEYGFERGPDGVRFLVDGRPVHLFRGALPRKPMRLYVNVWWPRWLDPERARGATRLLVDWVERPAR